MTGGGTGTALCFVLDCGSFLSTTDSARTTTCAAPAATVRPPTSAVWTMRVNASRNMPTKDAFLEIAGASNRSRSGHLDRSSRWRRDIQHGVASRRISFHRSTVISAAPTAMSWPSTVSITKRPFISKWDRSLRRLKKSPKLTDCCE